MGCTPPSRESSTPSPYSSLPAALRQGCAGMRSPQAAVLDVGRCISHGAPHAGSASITRKGSRTRHGEGAGIHRARQAYLPGSGSSLSPPYLKNTPLRSSPISANRLVEVLAASEVNVKLFCIGEATLNSMVAVSWKYVPSKVCAGTRTEVVLVVPPHCTLKVATPGMDGPPVTPLAKSVKSGIARLS